MTSRVSILGGRRLDTTVAWCGDEAIAARTLLADAAALAPRLPPAGTPLNLCSDRYAFSVALLAALLRGQTSLMPPNALPETLRHSRLPGTSPYAMSDGALEGIEMPLLGVAPGRLASAGPAPEVDGELPAVCLLTSGSTGLPQPHHRAWAELQQSIAAQGEAMAALMGWPGVEGLNIVASVPPQHSYGFESSVLLGLFCGCAFDAGRPFYPADIVAALERLPHPRALVTTPFHLKTLLRAGLALPPTELVLCATAPLPPQLAQQAEDTFGARVLEIYGCTEAGQVAARRTVTGDVWATTGGMRIHAEPGPAGEGEDGERFFVTGGPQRSAKPLADRLELIDAQHFRLIGRANDLIHVAGKRSSLSFLNYHLNRVPGVHDGAFWLPDEVPAAVVRPIAFVVAPELTARHITEGLRGPVEAVFLPRQVVFVPELPREANGKLTTGALDRFARQTLARSGPLRGPGAAGLPEQPADGS